MCDDRTAMVTSVYSHKNDDITEDLYDLSEKNLLIIDKTRSMRFERIGTAAVIGRAADCDVRIDSRIVSSHHGTFFRREDGWFYRDDHSSNGTYINGKRIQPDTLFRLTDGDVLRIDHADFSHPHKESVLLVFSTSFGGRDEWIVRTQRQLQRSLIETEESNRILERLSKIDELTGCYNRRGFNDEAKALIGRSAGRSAVMVFADLDSLKIINDRFGHDDGDFAIKLAADILRRSFEGCEYVCGRIGGDEFVVCSLVEPFVTAENIRSVIERNTSEDNARYGSAKPYIVHLSTGIDRFECSPAADIEELMAKADILLYDRKKYKKSILKEQ